MVTVSRQNDYRDLDLDFIAHPVTKDLVAKVGPDAVARSIRNLVMTNFYDRPFQPSIGSNVWKSLFENMTPVTERNLETHIKEVIVNYEPRASVVGVKVTADIDNNGYRAKIVFAVANRAEPYQLTFFLERTR